MPNLASILKDEIRRLARKVVRADTLAHRKQLAQARRDIAQLKKLTRAQGRTIAFLEAQEKRRVSRRPASPEEARGARFSAKWLKAHRRKLGLSAAKYGKLVGVTGLSVYNWEKGSTKPHPRQLAALVAVRGLGKREAQKRLELLGAK